MASKLFGEARALMLYALQLSEQTHGDTHPCHAQTLLIYGFYLLNISKLVSSRTHENYLQDIYSSPNS